jgi:4'-phosphopantetheinyl transferase
MQIRWLEQLQADVPGDDEWLSTAEQARLAGLRIPKRRADWRLGRWTAKLAVAACLEWSADPSTLAKIEIIPAEGGAPEAFIAGRPAPVSISISHRDGRAVCAVAPAESIVGCDLELIEERSPAFVSDYFTAAEQKIVGDCPDADRARLIALLWSAKESTLKTLRTGLRLDTREISVDVHGWPPDVDADSWRELHTQYGERAFAGWWRTGDGFIRTCICDASSMPPTLLVPSLRADHSSVTL